MFDVDPQNPNVSEWSFAETLLWILQKTTRLRLGSGFTAKKTSLALITFAPPITHKMADSILEKSKRSGN